MKLKEAISPLSEYFSLSLTFEVMVHNPPLISSIVAFPVMSAAVSDANAGS